MSIVTSDEVLSSANLILKESGLIENDLVSIRQCNSSILSALYEGLTKQELPGKRRGVWSSGSINEGVRCQHVIDAIAKLLPPEISLNHISGRDIADGDLLSIKNILDIFSILYNVSHPIPHRHGYETSYNESDSNLLTEGGMQVINEVLKEELDSAHLSTSSLISSHTEEDHPHQSPSPPTITVPSATHHVTFTNTSTDDTLSMTTPIKHPHKLTTPIHSTPRKGLSSVTSSHGSSTHTSDDGVIPYSNTPPLSISTLSTDSSSMAPPTSITPPKQSALDSATQTDQSLTLTPSVKEITLRDDDDDIIEGAEEGEEPEETLTCTARDDIIERIVNNYQQKNKNTCQEMKGNNRKTRYSSRSNRPSMRIKGKHSPRLSKRSFNPPPPPITEEDELYYQTTHKQHHNNKITEDYKRNNCLLTCVEEAMPGITLSPSTVRKYWTTEINQMKAKASYRSEPPNPMRKKVSDVERRHKALVEVLRKDLNHSRRMQSIMEEKLQRSALQSMIRNQRHATVRAKRYFKDYELAVKAKLQNRRTKEQKVFRDTYEDCLAILKEKVIEMRRFAKEKQLVEVKKYEIQLESMEAYYKDQLQMLSEAIKEDEKNTKLRDKAHQQDAKKVERELRKTMESNITKLWAGLETWEDTCAHFRELDKETLKKRFL